MFEIFEILVVIIMVIAAIYILFRKPKIKIDPDKCSGCSCNGGVCDK